MDTPEAEVIAVGRGRATVSVDAAAVCQRCAAGRGCGAGLFASKNRPTLLDVNVAGGIELHVGDRVRLSLAPAQLLRAAWYAYGLPLVALVIAVLVASRIVEPGNDPGALLFALTGLAAGAWYGRRAMRRAGCLHEFVPSVTERAASLPGVEV